MNNDKKDITVSETASPRIANTLYTNNTGKKESISISIIKSSQNSQNLLIKATESNNPNKKLLKVSDEAENTDINNRQLSIEGQIPTKSAINDKLLGVPSNTEKRKLTSKSSNQKRPSANEKLLSDPSPSDLNDLKKQGLGGPRKDFYGSFILKKGKKHKVTFIDSVKKGKLEEVVPIKKISAIEDSFDAKEGYKVRNSTKVYKSSNNNNKNSNTEKSGSSQAKPVDENCSCACVIF
eukprot:CAMPEP_0170530074 /NCGR_PEP_ID=MMETSP0209-20121228/40606_1 /TAXON_ID=665100 ORGANISM="Litonotus pictus, Strain P1" /NCGR_SAMPLE_ID=MMETSP0209 /ASSEMBLY_ACC=CAM_ASM_000301 /LENGTH=236 /DNA_ID=CAMNT_0010822787 /DNA_START=64 /DNA_END=775 /DNA_ORIENTATION=+